MTIPLVALLLVAVFQSGGGTMNPVTAPTAPKQDTAVRPHVNDRLPASDLGEAMVRPLDTPAVKKQRAIATSSRQPGE